MSATSPRRGAIVTVYAVAVAIGATLLFLIQPMFARVVLPPLGGAPAVWTTSVLFFQVVLLGAYLYAHALGRHGFTPTRAAIHLLLVAVGALWLPLDIGWTRTLAAGSPPAWRLVVAATAALGVPLFAVAATAPLVQRWFMAIDPARADQAYALYAASNAGSLGGLLAYPLIVERIFTLNMQSRLWQVGYFALTASLLAAAGLAYRYRPLTVRPDAIESDRSPEAPSWPLTLSWLVRAGAAAALMQSVTLYLTTDIAASPLLWVLPLSAYLLTFVLAFAPRLKLPIRLVTAMVPVAGLVAALALLTTLIRPTWVLLAVHLVCVFVLALGCHVAIAGTRPPARHLTAFYLWLALGGALGSAFTVLLAPHLFTSAVEYPIAIIVACLVRPGAELWSGSRHQWLMDGAWVLGTIALALGARALLPHAGVESHSFAMLLAAGALPVTITTLQWPHARRFAVMLGAVLLCAPDMYPMNVLHASRNFFGVLRVAESGDGKVTQFFHGSTLHGGEWRDPARRHEPLEYYGRVGPVGQVFATLAPRLAGAAVAIVGLGMGGLAAYAQPGQHWEFIEIDPDVAAIAADTRYFHFLADARTPIRVVLDDGRLSLSRAQPGRYALIVMDAFSSDSVPVHLITTDALAVYRRALRPDGLLLINVSNRYLDLAPIAGTVGLASGFHGCTRFHDVTEKERLDGLVPSTWVALAMQGDVVAALAAQPGWHPLDRTDRPAWTDDFADVFGAIMWRR